MLNTLMSSVTGGSTDTSGLHGNGDCLVRRPLDMSTMLASGESLMVDASDKDDGSEDVYARLQQKETDLILAAELGKALLEKNEELKSANETLERGYAERIEVRAMLFRSCVGTCVCNNTVIVFVVLPFSWVTLHGFEMNA